MFAKEDLIHVKPPKGSFRDKKTPTYFVPATRLDEFRNEKEKRQAGQIALEYPGVTEVDNRLAITELSFGF